MRLMKVPLGGGPPHEVLSGRFNDTPRCAKSPARSCAVAVETSDHKQLIFTGFDPVAGGRTRELLRFDIDPNVKYDGEFMTGTRVPYSWTSPRMVAASRYSSGCNMKFMFFRFAINRRDGLT
jgi:hypothetical protein